MNMNFPIHIVRISAVLIGSIGAAGCGVSTPTTYPVEGKVQVQGADLRALAGARVQAVLVEDLRVEAQGEIQDDGTFTLETIHDGKSLSGVQAGEYQVRIVLSDEDRGYRRRKGQVIAPRFAQYKTSGLTFLAPASDTVVLELATK
jgi:hypothetical protein